jgi:hypothetical protein
MVCPAIVIISDLQLVSSSVRILLKKSDYFLPIFKKYLVSYLNSCYFCSPLKKELLPM